MVLSSPAKMVLEKLECRDENFDNFQNLDPTFHLLINNIIAMMFQLNKILYLQSGKIYLPITDVKLIS